MSPSAGARRKITGEISLSKELAQELKREIGSLKDLTEKLTSWQTDDTSTLLMSLLGSAVFLRASDLHLEAEEQGAKLRVRIDGMLQDVALLSEKTHEAAVWD